MEDLEKELNDSCNCCEDCTCGDECHCTPDNKCCPDCTCDENCNCGCDHTSDCKDEMRDCETKNDCDNECDCNVDTDKNDSDDDCVAAEDNCDKDKCDSEDNCDRQEDEDKCKCGCGESVEQESCADAYFKQLLSLRAEFDNYRKRTQNDISKAYSNGFNQAITEFLPALDSFKMATEYITDPNTLVGIQYIEKGILNTLEKIGVKVIDVSGKFDPDFHQAIGSEISPEHESGDIIKECFKGFIMGDKVIRYSQVIVAK